jgi:hypothetical protein
VAKHLLADGICDRANLLDNAAFHNLVLEIAPRSDDQPGIKVLPQRCRRRPYVRSTLCAPRSLSRSAVGTSLTFGAHRGTWG